MSTNTRGVTLEQLRQAIKEFDLTVAAVAEGSGLSKAYISEFRAGIRNLTPGQQAQLRAYLEALYVEQGGEFPAEDPASSQDLILQGLQKMGGQIQAVTRPAIMLASHIHPERAEQLANMIEGNRQKVAEILEADFEGGGLLGGQFSGQTEEAIRELFALLAINYLAILMLQGRDIVGKGASGGKHQTIGDWFSSHLSDSPIGPHLQDDQSEAGQPQQEAA